jgi:subtilisin-like proprotein convertase family protein
MKSILYINSNDQNREPMKAIINIIISFLLVIALYNNSYSQCSYQVSLYDTYGDGWNDGYISVEVNGISVIEDMTVETGTGPEVAEFTVSTGDVISITYTAGSWSVENEITVYDSEGNVVYEDGMNNETPTGGEVGVASCPACPEPFDIAFSNIGMEDATLTYGMSDNVVSVSVEWGVEGFTPTGVPSGTFPGTTMLFQDLTPGATYDVYLMSNCDTDGVSTWAGPYSFTTLTCLPVDACEYTMDMDDTGNSWNGASITVIQNGVNIGEFTVSGGGENTETVSLCSGSTIELVWTSGVYDNECIFSLIDPYGNVEYSWTAGGAPSAGTFHTFVNNCTPPTCPPPTDFTVQNVTTNTASLSWNDGGAGTSWQIEYGFSGFSPEGIPEDVSAFENYTIAGLSSHTAYDVYVRADCGDGDYSEWVGPVTFVTEIMPLSNPTNCGENLFILDGTCTEIPIVVSTPGTSLGSNVELTDVNLIIEHTYDYNLTIALVSPQGTKVYLSQYNGGSGDNYGMLDGTCEQVTNFTMNGEDGYITSGTAPFVGSYTPQGDLASFNDGSDPNGEWILEICETSTNGSGAFQFAELIFEISGNEAEIVLYSFPEQESAAVIDSVNQTVNIMVDWEADLTNLTAEFELSPGASAVVNAVDQESGITSNNFSSPAEYDVTSINGMVTKTWTIYVEQEPIPQGAFCEDPIPLTLPAIDIQGTTDGYGDNYDNSMLCTSSYMNGDDIVYEFTIPVDGTLSGSLTGSMGWIGMFIVDGCPDDAGICTIKKTSTSNEISFTDEVISSGTYFLVISNFAPPQSFNYSFDLSFTPSAGFVDLAVIDPQIDYESCNLSVESIDIEIINTGSENILQNDTIPVFFDNDGLLSEEEIILEEDLQPGDTVIYTFISQADCSEPGEHYVTIGANYQYDQFLDNDEYVELFNNTMPEPEITQGDTLVISAGELPYTLTLTENYTMQYWVKEDGSENSVAAEFIVNSFGVFNVTVWNDEGCSGDDQILITYPLSELTVQNQNVVKLYPNPNYGKFIVECSVFFSDEVIRIYDCYGRVVFINKIAEKKRNFEIDVTGLSNGIYVLEIVGKGNVIKRFEKL